MSFFIKHVLLYWLAALGLTILLLGVEDSEGAVSLNKGIAETVCIEAERNGIDPDLITAIILVESGGRPYSLGRAGEIGLLQLRPEFHEVTSFNYIHNIRIGVSYLRKIKARHGGRHPDTWWVYYNIGPNNKRVDNLKNTRYYKRVTNKLQEIRNVPTNHRTVSENCRSAS